MKEFLTKIGLCDKLNMELPIQKDEFVKILKSNIDQHHSYFSEILSESPNVYQGIVGENNFELRRKRRLFDMK